MNTNSDTPNSVCEEKNDFQNFSPYTKIAPTRNMNTTTIKKEINEYLNLPNNATQEQKLLKILENLKTLSNIQKNTGTDLVPYNSTTDIVPYIKPQDKLSIHNTINESINPLLDSKLSIQKPISESIPTTNNTESNISPTTDPDVHFQNQKFTLKNYKRAILLTGDTKPIKETLKSKHSGRWNPSLQGWIFKPADKQPLVDFLSTL
jgi:hypothetical protein